MELHILGTRGVPANHSGFETFAEQLALYLGPRGHKVVVYCQLAAGETAFTDEWNGIHRVAFPEKDGPWGTIAFDLRTARMAARCKDATLLTLGYNTAVFSLIHRIHGRYNVMNMDGLEWKRQKWSRIERLWFAINECCGAFLANHLVADHPEIRNHLMRYVSRKKITVIPYGADKIEPSNPAVVEDLGLKPGNYALVIARPEPENSVLEIVEAYSRKPRPYKLIVLGRYRPDANAYHDEVVRCGEPYGVLYPGAIHDHDITQALRQFALVYIHGHQVGGTNPSLVASLAAGNAVIAHDNRFNRWVAGSSAQYFNSADEMGRYFDQLDAGTLPVEEMRNGSRQQHEKFFTNLPVLLAYEQLLMRQPMKETHWSSER